jgi:hypothetical protein
VARIDPELRPDFCLAELNRAQWRNSALLHLLATGYLIFPALASLLVGLARWREDEIFSIIASSMAIRFLADVATNLAFGGVGIASLGALFSALGTSTFGIGVIGGIAPYLTGKSDSYGWARRIVGVVVGMLSLVAYGALFVASGDLLSAQAQNAARNLPFGPNFIFPINIGLTTAAGVAGSVLLAIVSATRVRNVWRTMAVCVMLILLLVGALVGALGVALNAPETDEGQAGLLLAGALSGGLSFSALFVLPYRLAERIAGPWAGAVAGVLSGSGLAIVLSSMDTSSGSLYLPLSLGALVLGLTFSFWRPILLYPLLAVYNLILFRFDQRGRPDRLAMLRYHSAFWDEHQRLPLIGLDDHIVLVAERRPPEGRAAIEYLSTSHQRWAAQAAQIELDARGLERCTNETAIGRAHHGLAAGELEGPASALLRSFSRVSKDVEAALRQESAYNKRLALSAVEDRLNGLLRELTRSSERYAARFRPIAARWREIIAAHVRGLAEAVEQRQEIDSPYIIGVPLTEQQEIFVGRADISVRIEQLLLDRRRPPLLLYGQRRMGKTSLLNNLGRLLPGTTVPLFVDLQGPAANAEDDSGLLYNLARSMVVSAQRQRVLSLPALPRETLFADPFTRFDEWLDTVERALGDRSALLLLDEFEALDSAIARGRFDEVRVMGMLRNVIQHRPRFKVLLAASHTLEELQKWSSYLINVQVVRISYLKQAEARQLVEYPVKDFALRYDPDASQRVLDLTGCHPFLTQLLCAEIVALKNEQDPAVRRLARLADVEAAVPDALSSGSFFFADIQRNQVDAAGLNVLRSLAKQGEGAVVAREELTHELNSEFDNIIDLLIKRELIASVDGGYRFQVELIRRWFAERSQ